MKPTLLIIEGPDRVSKDTVLADKYENFKSYIPIKDTPPDYRTEQKDFVSCLSSFLEKQQKELIHFGKEMNKNILMVRLFTSEFVYSSLFNRGNIFNEKYPNYVQELSRII